MRSPYSPQMSLLCTKWNWIFMHLMELNLYAAIIKPLFSMHPARKRHHNTANTTPQIQKQPSQQSLTHISKPKQHTPNKHPTKPKSQIQPSQMHIPPTAYASVWPREVDLLFLRSWLGNLLRSSKSCRTRVNHRRNWSTKRFHIAFHHGMFRCCL